MRGALAKTDIKSYRVVEVEEVEKMLERGWELYGNPFSARYVSGKTAILQAVILTEVR